MLQLTLGCKECNRVVDRLSIQDNLASVVERQDIGQAIAVLLSRKNQSECYQTLVQLFLKWKQHFSQWSPT